MCSQLLVSAKTRKACVPAKASFKLVFGTANVLLAIYKPVEVQLPSEPRKLDSTVREAFCTCCILRKVCSQKRPLLSSDLCRISIIASVAVTTSSTIARASVRSHRCYHHEYHVPCAHQEQHRPRKRLSRPYFPKGHGPKHLLELFPAWTPVIPFEDATC